MDFMLCKDRKNIEPFKGRDRYVAELKRDGSRVAPILDGGELKKMVNRRGFEISNKFPEFNNIRVKDKWVLDGEVVLVEDGKDNFNKLLVRTQQENEFKIELLSEKIPCKIVIFDVLEKNGEDLRNKKLRERRKYLNEFFNEYLIEGEEHLIKAKQYTRIEDLWDRVVSENLEGVIVKDLNSKYVGKRSDKWLKCKNKKEIRLKFTKYEEHNKGITIETDEGIRVTVNGHKSKEVRDILDNKGGVDVQIQYLNKTTNGKYRQPTFKRIKR